MTLWIVENIPPILIDRQKDNVMDSAVNYLKRKDDEIRTPYIPGRLFTDSGGYVVVKKNLKIDPLSILEIQEKLGSNIVLPLDYPFVSSNLTINIMKKFWEKTKRNMILWRDHLGPNIEISAVLHTWSKSSADEAIRWIYRNMDSANYVSIGSVIKYSQGLIGYFADRELRGKAILDLLLYVISKLKQHGFKIHLMGYGSSPLMLHIGYFIGADSLDSSGYRRKAAYGKIFFHSFGERYVGDGRAKFGATYPKPFEFRELAKCKCPVCRKDPTLIWKDWRARAIHNEWVLKEEQKIASKLKDDVVKYEKYIDRLTLNSRNIYYRIWKPLKMLIRYKYRYHNLHQ